MALTPDPFFLQDTGVGIPAEDVPKVVQRFHRVATTARSHEGTGEAPCRTAGGNFPLLSDRLNTPFMLRRCRPQSHS